jgi:hypothetical protein
MKDEIGAAAQKCVARRKTKAVRHERLQRTLWLRQRSPVENTLDDAGDIAGSTRHSGGDSVNHSLALLRSSDTSVAEEDNGVEQEGRP